MSEHTPQNAQAQATANANQNVTDIGSVQEIWSKGYETPWMRIHACRTGHPDYAAFFEGGEKEVNGEVVEMDAMFATSVAINLEDGSTQWVDVRAYRKLAELLNKHVKEGKNVVRFDRLEGYSRQGKPYTDKQGQTRVPMFVVIKKFDGVTLTPHAGSVGTDADALDKIDFDPFVGQKVEAQEAANKQQGKYDPSMYEEREVEEAHAQAAYAGSEAVNGEMANDIPF